MGEKVSLETFFSMYSSDRRLRNSILPGYVFVFFSSLTKNPDALSVFVRELRESLRFSPRTYRALAPFLDHVMDIVFLRTEKEVVRVHAQRSITAMKNREPLRYNANKRRVSPSMRKVAYPLVSQFPVLTSSSSFRKSEPDPAAGVRLRRARPKNLFCNSHAPHPGGST